MAESETSTEHGSKGSVWTLRLAGGQDDANLTLWSAHVRSTSSGSARLRAFLGRCRWVMLGVFAGVLAPAAAWVLTMTPTYAVSLRLFVEAEREGGEGYLTRPVLPTELATEIEALQSRELLLEVAERAGLDRQVASGSAEEKLEEAVRILQQNLSATPTPESSVISVEYRNTDPKLAAAGASALAEVYLEGRAGPRRGGESAEVFQAQAGRYATELQTAQAELDAFEERSRNLLMEGQKQAAASRRARLTTEKNSIEGLIGQVETRLGLLARQADALPANVVSQSGGALNEPLMQQLRGLVDVLQRQRAELLANHGPQDRLVSEVEQRLAQAKLAIERLENSVVVEEGETVGPLRRAIDAEYVRAQSEIAGLRSRRQAIDDSLRATEGQQTQLEEVAEQHAALERAVQAAEANYLPYQSPQGGSRGASLLGSGRSLEVSALEPPSAPAIPPNQSRPMLLLFATLLAAGAAIGAAVLYDPYVKPAAYVADIASATGAPVLMMVEETHSHVS